jgi:protein-S-isoprenylcysteine O-methyltransferase Ste14
MRPLVFTWPYALFFWAVYLWVFAPEFGLIRRSQRRAANPDSPDAGSLLVVLVGFNTALALAFVFAFVPTLRFPAAAAMPAFWIGLVLLAGGSLLRRHCWRVLGDSFTGDVRAVEGQKIIDRGAYRWVRHPSYSAGIVMVLGIGAALDNWGSLIIPPAIAAAAYSYRIVVEERALMTTLGDRYGSYARSRKRLIPFIV